VVAYAASLGLNAPAKDKDAPAVSACIAPTVAKPAARAAAAKPAPAEPAGTLAPLAAVTVRASNVHAVPETAAAAAPVAATTIAAAAPTPSAASAVAPAAPLPAQLPSPPPAAATAAVAKTDVMPPGRGASDCLSVESDGTSLGFRNRCSYNVQFAYCVQDKSDPKTPCDVETRAGNVGGTAFLALLRDTNIRSEDAEHNFHWVGCSGGAGDVTAYLDRAEPAAGRCVLKASPTLTTNTPKNNEGAKS
jgi:hypothetical protein